jgi:hypothetical protein
VDGSPVSGNHAPEMEARARRPASFADISDDDPPSLPIMLFDNECTPGEL